MAKKKKALKTFEYVWSFENFEEHLSFYTKRMFGGLAAYVHNKMMLMIAEDTGKTEYRGIDYGFEIWNGILYPTEYGFHESLQNEFPELIQHPVLKKWLYLPSTTKNFESIAHDCALCIRKNDKRFGIYPQTSTPSKKKSKKKKIAKKKPLTKKTKTLKKKKKTTKKVSKKKS